MTPLQIICRAVLMPFSLRAGLHVKVMGFSEKFLKFAVVVTIALCWLRKQVLWNHLQNDVVTHCSVVFESFTVDLE